MLAILIPFVFVFLAALAAWYFVSKYFKSSDVDKIKQRLTGPVKSRKKIQTKADGPKSVIHSEGLTKNKLAQLVVEKWSLGPRIALLLEQAGLRWAPARLVHLSLVSFSVVFTISWLMLPIPKYLTLIPGIVAGFGPVVYVTRKKKARLKKFEEIFPETLEFISRSMRAGHAFSVSLEMISREFAEPLAGEFRRTFEEHNLGLPMDVALQKFAQRVPSMDVHFFVSAVLLQKRTGGNLAEILDKLAYIMRERFKLRGRIRAVSAHGRMTATSLSCIPIAVAVLMFFTNPDYVKFFFNDDTGNIMLGAAVALQVIGYLIMNKIVNIEV